jgi:hypothetical protein
MPNIDSFIENNRIRIDFPVMIKASPDDDEMVIYIDASNEHLDREGEVVLQQALIASKDYFLQHGVISYDHLHKLERDPKYIIGEPMEVRFGNGGDTFAKARLYNKVPVAKTIYNLIRSDSSKVKASVGGSIEEKRGNTIIKVQWDEIALTVKPVNDSLTQATITPLNVFAKSFSKSYDKKGVQDDRNLVDEMIPNDRAILEMDTPGKYERPIFHVANAIIMGKLKSYDEIIHYLRAMDFTDFECREILTLLNNKSDRMKFMLNPYTQPIDLRV